MVPSLITVKAPARPISLLLLGGTEQTPLKERGKGFFHLCITLTPMQFSPDLSMNLRVP